MQNLDDTRKPPIDLARLQSFSDGIYAFSMTLLVTGMHLPVLSEQEAETRLLQVIGHDWRFLVAYVSSFLTISGYWLLHHTIYASIRKADRVFIWLNILLLLTVTFLPFPTALMGRYGRQPDTAFIYGAVISLTYLLMNLMTWYACQNRRLTRSGLTDQAIRVFRVRMLIPLFLAICGTLLALSMMRLAFLIFIAMALFNSLPPLCFFRRKS